MHVKDIYIYTIQYIYIYTYVGGWMGLLIYVCAYAYVYIFVGICEGLRRSVLHGSTDGMENQRKKNKHIEPLPKTKYIYLNAHPFMNPPNTILT